jgi:ankyrin repeat protein
MYYRNNSIINVKNNKGETPIFTTPSVEIGRFLIEKGCDLKLRSYPQWDATPLHTAKNAEMIDLLVQYIDVNSATSYGYTPLHSTDNLNVARALIRNGANLNAQLKNGQTPLHVHVNINPDIALLLVEKGADVNIKTIYGFTPLFDVRNPELARKIASKADPEIKVLDHYTALLWHIVKADYPNNIERGRIVREIIAGCPEMATIPTGWNYSPLHCVQDVETAEALLNAGADINYLSSPRKDTPLHCQIKDGHYDVARYLIDKGAKLNERDSDGKTPLSYCEDSGLKEYMKSMGAE